MNRLRALVALLTLSAVAGFGCGDGELTVEIPTVSPDNTVTVASMLSQEMRRERATMIRDAAAGRGLTNGVLLAGIADAETNMAHCWSEATWACKGPASSSCGGGPIIAGSGDGACSRRQGGLGLFQFDAGTHDQTLSREGRRILTIQGNTQAAVDFVVSMVVRSDFVSGVSSSDQALTWLNNVRPDTPQWDQWIRTVTGYYNGCFEGRCGVFYERYNNYDSKTRRVLDEFGNNFWYRLSGDGGVSTPGPGSNSTEPNNNGGTQASSAHPSKPEQMNPVSAHVPSGGSVALSWQSVNAARYTIRMEYKDGSRWEYYYEWERTRDVFEVWPQIRDTEYRWTVRACNNSGCSRWSDYTHFTYGEETSSTTSDEPEEPSSNSSSTGSSGSSTGSSNPPPSNGLPGMPASMRPAGVRIDTPDVPLTWSEPVDASRYDIIMYYHDGTDWTHYYMWENKSGGAFTVWPVVDETYYSWAIRACNTMGCSEWSDFQQFYFAGK